jgi:hypothetical protein
VFDHYHHKYDRKCQEIRHRYENYQKLPESHPKYIETWNFYWLENFYKLNENDRGVDKCDFTPKWRGYWEQRFLELREEEELEMRVKLHEQMGMTVDSEDKAKMKAIRERSLVMIKEKSPRVPIISETCVADLKIQSLNSRLLAKNDKLIELPPHIKALKNSELVVLFENIDTLSDGLRKELMELMNLMEINEPERYHALLSICLNDGDPKLQASMTISQNTSQVQQLESEESYTLEEVLDSAQQNLEYGPALTPERYQDSEIIDLTIE